MYPANQSGTGFRLRHALAGLQAGVLGTLAMLACLAVGSMWDRRSVWVGPNLFATSFYGADVYYNHYASTAWAGLALLVVVYGGLGILWGCAWREEQKPLLAVYGAVLGMVVYFVLFDFVWKKANGLVVLYAPTTQLEFGHALWGMILSRSPRYSRRIAEQMKDSPAPPPVQSADGDAAAIPSGPAAE